MRLVCPLPELTTTTACFQFGENPGDWAGILAHLAASQLFPETMEEGLAATTNGLKYRLRCLDVHRRPYSFIGQMLDSKMQ